MSGELGMPVGGTTLWWFVGIVLGFPLLVIAFGELAERLERADSPLAAPLRLARNVALPLVVVTLFLRFVLERPTDALDLRLATSAVSIVAVAVVLSLVTELVFTDDDPDSWRGQAPRLLVAIIRTALVAVVAAVVVGTVWQVNLFALFAALGIGGLAVGLALQSTLASLIGGIALLTEKPFTVGDWIAFDGVEGRVEDINWRTVRLRTRQQDLVVIPNSAFDGSIVHNNSRPEREHDEVVGLGFSYDDPPGEVHDVLRATAAATPGVLTDRPITVRTVNYGDSSIDYEVWLRMADVDRMPDIRSAFMTRVWYAAERHGLTIPFPMRTVHMTPGEVLEDRAEQRAEAVRRDGLRVLDTVGGNASDDVAQASEVRRFTAGEVLMREGGEAEGLGLLVTGELVAVLAGPDGDEREVLRLGPGQFYGESASLGLRPNRFTVRAVTDVEVVRIPQTAAQALARRSQRFAAQVEEVRHARAAAAERVLEGERDLATT